MAIVPDAELKQARSSVPSTPCPLREKTWMPATSKGMTVQKIDWNLL
jgi:hypothetical protein